MGSGVRLFIRQVDEQDSEYDGKYEVEGVVRGSRRKIVVK